MDQNKLIFSFFLSSKINANMNVKIKPKNFYLNCPLLQQQEPLQSISKYFLFQLRHLNMKKNYCKKFN